MALSRLFPLILLGTLGAAELEISRPVRSWEFLDALGPKAGILGHEDGTLEAYTYPLKIFKELRLRFVLDGHVIAGESVARRIISRPGSYTIVYSGDEYEVRETLAASVDRAGAVIRLQVNAHSPLRIDVEFAPDFQLMWPASIGTSYGEWNEREKAWLFGADGQPFAAVLGSPNAALLERGAVDRFTLGVIEGTAERVLAFGGSVKSREEAMAVYRSLAADPQAVIAAAEKHDQDYLARTVGLTLPDKELQAAYDWSKLSMRKGMVENPLLGAGLVAGYGPSRGVYRPGFAWYFGRDTFWTSLAMTSMGDLANTRTAIAFIAKYQREDGKIPHEISQSASLVPWFQNYPYGYASADGTPLYVIAVQNYVQASGDIAFAREQWPRLQKAFEFMRAHFEAHGFPKNYQVGHGWVEGGPLLPVEVELYQAGCYVQALRAMAALARAVPGAGELAAKLDQEFESKRKTLDELFWLPQSKTYAFALDTSAKPVDQPTVLATVPMWFNVLNEAHSREAIEQLSDEPHQADWGMRIISSKSPAYGPEGYHYGSVWPLFTGWASVGEYRYHAAHAAYANLRANAWLALDGAGGNPTEVLSGMTYTPLSTASPHQIWSAAMVVSPLLRGLCGLDVDAANRHVTLAPHLPADWPGIAIERVPVGDSLVDFTIQRGDKSQELRVFNHGTASIQVRFAPAYSPAAVLLPAKFDGSPIANKVLKTPSDQHPEFEFTAAPGEHTLTIPHRAMFGFSLHYDPPRLGAYSENLKIVSERWAADKRSVELTVSGRASKVYQLHLTGAKSADLLIEMPAGEGYVHKTVTISAR